MPAEGARPPGAPVKGVAFLYPGNLSACVGMVTELAGVHPEIQQTFAEASEVAEVDLWALVREGPEDRLRRDPQASLAILAADVALHRLVQEIGIAPVALAGYGPGYYAAVVAAGVVPLRAALEWVAEEQRIGWEVVGDDQYELADLDGLAVEQIEDVLGDLLRSEAVCLAAQDGPDRCSLAGETTALRGALARLEGQVRTVQVLPRTLPRHTPVMLPVPARLNAAFGRMAAQDPSTPIYSHYDGSIVLRGWQAKELMIRGMIYPLRWDQCVRGLVRNGIDTFIEVGPGSRLAELVRRIEPSTQVFTSDGLEALEKLRSSFSSWNF